MKKIVIVSNSSWYLFNFRFRLASFLKEKGYKIIFIAPYDQYSKFLKKNYEYHNIYMNNMGVNPIQEIKTIINFYKLYKKIKPDIVLQYTIKPNIYGSIVCRFLNIKTINNIAGLGSLFVNQSFITKIAKCLYKYSQKKSKKVFFQNKVDYEMFISEKLVDKNISDILPGSGVDTNKFLPIMYEKKHNTFVFLLIARLLWEKGVGVYVEAAKIIKDKYNDVEFQLLGFLNVANKSSISKEQIQKWENEGLVNYLGISDNVEEVISKADCIVLPSYYREGTPRTLLESASMAKPIITTDNVGCRDVVDDGINGFLCKIKNVKDLSEKMEMMLDLSQEERNIMGEKGREKMIREYDENIVIYKYLNVIKKIEVAK